MAGPRLCVWALVLLAASTVLAQDDPPPPGLQPGLRFPEGTAPEAKAPFAELPEPACRLRHEGGCWSLSLSADGSLLASVNGESEVAVFDTTTGEAVWTWGQQKVLNTSAGELAWPGIFDARKPTGWPGVVRAFFSPSSHRLAVLRNPGFLPDGVFVHGVLDWEFDPRTWYLGGYVHLFEPPLFTTRGTVETEPPIQFPGRRRRSRARSLGVTAAGFSPDGKLLAAGSSNGMLGYWDVETQAGGASVRAGNPGLRSWEVGSLDFSPDGKLIATISGEGYVRVWSMPRLEPYAKLARHALEGFWVEFSPDGHSVASAGWDGKLQVWDLETQTPVATCNWGASLSRPPDLDFAPGGASILFGGTEDAGVIGNIDCLTGEITDMWPAGLPDVRCFALSPKGDVMAAASEDGELVVWRMAEGDGPPQ